MAATALALFSAWHSIGHVWHRIGDDRRTFAHLSATDRSRAAASATGVDGAVLEWYAGYVARGDRFYVQADPGHVPRLIELLAGYYLLPAVEVSDLSQATVVISYYADPSTLGVRFLTRTEAGLQPIYVSRIAAP